MAENTAKDKQLIIDEFHKIAQKEWIKSVNKGLGSIGYTFEEQLKKKPDSLYFPDYYGTEIKCSGKYSRYPITLFTTSFDGPTFPEINRIIENWGYPDKDFPNKKIIFANINCKRNTKIESNVSLKLEINYKEEKLYLCVYNKNNELIEKESFVYLDTLYKHLFLKLKRIALIYANKRIKNKETYFHYYKMSLFELKSFETFIKQLENGKIKVSLIARISKSGIDKGRYRNQNLVFKIKKDEMEYLFNNIYEYNYEIQEKNV